MQKANSKSRLKSVLRKIAISIAVALIWFLIWQLISVIVDKEFLLPAPGKVLTRLGAFILSTEFWRITFVTILRIVIGFVAGTVIGTVLAVFTARFKAADTLLSPARNIIKATPIASFIILALVWIKGGNIPSFICFLMVLPIVWGNVARGIIETDPKLLEMAHVYRFRKRDMFFKIYMHSVIPYFTTAVTTSMGLAWKAGIAAEVLAVPRYAIGTAIYDSKIYLEYVDLFAWSLVVILISILLEKIIVILLKKIDPAKKIYRNEVRQ